ncbi:MAG TPA: zinc dependent phospholipase C family protein [Anaerolineae bacterium]|nr:zinc dependent phospholipase C family protein [Anaerolineae bacterium]HQM13020.1 zinc dependent phospholipase C family protein [Anaerolineae bacterium]
MPTPFQHLNYANMILEAPELPSTLREQFQRHSGAFFLGNTAADVQTVTGQPRPTTHFYRIPPSGNPRGEVALLRAYPMLADPSQLSPEHAAFISGYLAHLVWDQRWAWDIYCRYYYRLPGNGDRLACLVEHNALRVWLDRQAEAQLETRPWLLPALQQTQPGDWLPFAGPDALRTWQSWIVEQLAHPGTAQTVAVFAARDGVPVEQLERATQRLSVQAESAAIPPPLQAVAPYEARALQESLAVLRRFWRCEPEFWESELPWLNDLTLAGPPLAAAPFRHG